MSLCVNGRWYADACRCFKFWTGRACDKRLCARGAGILTPKDGLCRCRPGFGGEFCQFEICSHNHKWYCNTTEMAPRTIWDEEDEEESLHPPAPCLEDVLVNWFRSPETITPAWYCNCGSGRREQAANDPKNLSALCVCDGGHFGEFCEKNICSLNGSVWHAENGTCIVPVKGDGIVRGYLGYDIHSELAAATILAFSLIAMFVTFGRWYIKKIDREALEMDERNKVGLPN